jgi:putative peptidoglycan lipid II flippase
MTTAAQPIAQPRQIARSTVIVMAGFAISQALSIAQAFLIADVFGVGAQWDAFSIANRVPETIFSLIAGGALATALIPMFGGMLARNERDGAWRLASHVINTIFVVAFVVSAVAFLLAPWLVQNFVAPGFDAAQTAETVGLMRVLLVTTLIFCISGTAMGILQSHNAFLAPALAPVLFDIGKLFGAAVLVGQFGVYGIAYGALIGAVLHLGIQIPALIRVGARWINGLGWNDPAVRRVFRLMLPRILDLGVFNFNMLMAGNLASQLGAGAVSAFNWGWSLMQIPETLIGTAMGLVIFPTLAAFSELNDVDGKRSAMSNALKFILIGTIPAAIGVVVMGRTAVSLLEGGAFDADATELVYIALRGFALGIILHSIIEVAARSFYADKDTTTPLLIAIGGAAVNVSAALLLSGVLTNQRSVEGVAGLTWANTLGVLFEVVFLLFVLRGRWQGIHEGALATTTAKTLMASMVMAVAILIFDALWSAAGLAGQGRAMTIVQVALDVLIGAGVFVAAAYALRLQELQTLIAQLFRRKPIAEAVV